MISSNPRFDNKVRICPFSQKYVDYYNKCLTTEINCLEGAYRAGKSVINIFSFANYLEHCKDKIHLVTGASVSTARLNVSDCNGLGLSYIFRGRCKTGKYEGNECIKIITLTGEKMVVFVGGGLSDSYKRIQGLSFGSWLSVELANLYISDDEKCFIDMAISRLTQSQDKKIWWDLNPVYESHKVYKKYLDKFAQNPPSGGYNYVRCSLFDNTALSEKQRNSFLSLYPDKESMEYQRYILGNRACAEGLIFKQFARNKDEWVVNDMTKLIDKTYKTFVSIGIDFGGNGSNTTFVATLIHHNYRGIHPFANDKIDMSGGNSDISEYNRRLKVFIQKVLNIGVAPLEYVFGDNADPVMISETRAVLRSLGLANSVRVIGCQKHTIKKRIDLKNLMISRHYWTVSPQAVNVIESTETQVWDSRAGHEDERLDNGTIDIDTADAEEYSWSAFLEKLVVNCRELGSISMIK